MPAGKAHDTARARVKSAVRLIRRKTQRIPSRGLAPFGAQRYIRLFGRSCSINPKATFVLNFLFDIYNLHTLAQQTIILKKKRILNDSYLQTSETRKYLISASIFERLSLQSNNTPN